MNTYVKMREALFALCKNEGLQLVEARLEDRTYIYMRKGDKIILNTNTNQLKCDKE